jgi:hypothetical protein
MKVYNKRGNKNYKERKLLKDLESIIQKKIADDPNFANEFVPATNYSELQKLHGKYVVEDIKYEESNFEQEEKEEFSEQAKSNKEMTKKTEEIEDVEFEETVSTAKTKSDSSSSFIDPFNRESPIVRDYVTDGESLKKEMPMQDTGKTFFEEPTTFEEAFTIPEAVDETDKQGSNTNRSERPKKEPSEPLNPHFDEMATGKKKRSTKKFAKYIVEAVATLSEKGFVWFANKDINDSKLAEYEMSGEMDLSLLVTLEDGQEVTVKQFFQVQCAKAEMLFQWTEEQKEDLSSALAEVLMEKGVAPTPAQECALIGLTIVGGQVMNLMALKSQTNSLLNQLREMKGGSGQVQEKYEEPPIKTEQPYQKDQDPKLYQDVVEEVNELDENENENETQMNDDFSMFNELAELSEQEVLISDNIDTKE